ncbi:MAG: glycoside hydrolase family 3 N-terminal domain-containing protein, partial [Casimicrobium sp.]
HKMKFHGVIFTDDASMVAAHAIADLAERAETAVQGGVDIVLYCNDRPGLIELLDRWKPETEPSLARKWERMRKKAAGKRH